MAEFADKSGLNCGHNKNRINLRAKTVTHMDNGYMGMFQVQCTISHRTTSALAQANAKQSTTPSERGRIIFAIAPKAQCYKNKPEARRFYSGICANNILSGPDQAGIIPTINAFYSDNCLFHSGLTSNNIPHPHIPVIYIDV